MSVDMAHHILGLLAKQYGRNFPKEGVQRVWPDLVKQPDKAMEAAYDWFVVNSTYLPSPAKLLEQVQKEAKRIYAEEAKTREQEWARQKGGETRRELERSGSVFSREQSTAHGRHAIEAIRLMLSDASRSDKLECYRVMEANYPGVGWGLTGARQQKEWGMDNA